jgi:RNA polymerase sigma factor (sigma-70 family)
MHNMRLVCHVAKGFVDRGPCDINDLISAGSVVMLNCIEKFDPDLGFKFCTYLWRGVFLACRREQTLESRWRDRLPQDRSQYGTDLPEDILTVDPLRTDSEATSMEISGDYAWKVAKRCLPRRQYRVLVLRMRGEVLEVIGDELGVSKERVRQLQKKAIATLRATLGVKFPK